MRRSLLPSLALLVPGTLAQSPFSSIQVVARDATGAIVRHMLGFVMRLCCKNGFCGES